MRDLLSKDPLFGDLFHRGAFDYHAQGDKWADKQLADFLADGLLNYYIIHFSRINLCLTSNYYLYVMTPNCTCLNILDKVQLFSIASIFLPADKKIEVVANHNPLLSDRAMNLYYYKEIGPLPFVKDYFDTIKTAIKLMARLKTSEPLLHLGAQFQRIKVECEKMVNNDNYGPNFLEKNRQAEILQTAICRWVEFYVDQIREVCKTRKIEGVDPETFSLACPPFILGYLKSNNIPADITSKLGSSASVEPAPHAVTLTIDKLKGIYLSFIPAIDFKFFKIARTGAADKIFTPGQTVQGVIKIMLERAVDSKEDGASSRTLAHPEVRNSAQPAEAAAASRRALCLI
jgi:hypothetical protein